MQLVKFFRHSSTLRSHVKTMLMRPFLTLTFHIDFMKKEIPFFSPFREFSPPKNELFRKLIVALPVRTFSNILIDLTIHPRRAQHKRVNKRASCAYGR